MKDEFGRAVKNARALKTWTLDELGRAMDGTSSTSFLSGIENGKRNIGLRTVGRLVKVLDLDESWVARFQDAEVDPDEEVTEVDRRTDRLLEEAKKLNAAGITEEAIIGYAQRTAGEIEDLAQAWTELQNLLEIALDVQTKAAAGSNHADAVDEVLRRSAERSREGDNKAALTGIEVALAAQEAQASRLLESGAEYALLDGDTARAANFLIRKADLEAGGRVRFDDLINIQNRYLIAGRDQDSILALRVAEDMTAPLLSRATNAVERGQALNNRGVALLWSGERISNISLLQESISAFSSAEKQWKDANRDTDWAMARMNRGNAISTICVLSHDPSKLDEVVELYESVIGALKRNNVNSKLAVALMNLGNVLLKMGEHQKSWEILEKAISNYEGSLEAGKDEPIHDGVRRMKGSRERTSKTKETKNTPWRTGKPLTCVDQPVTLPAIENNKHQLQT